MENGGWILLVFLALQLLITSSAFNMIGWWNIDCGGDSHIGDDLLIWEPDEDYTQTGANGRVQQNQPIGEMNTLRFFPDKSQQNCYIVPAYLQTLRYLVRVGFYYGNYDGLSNPPTFDLTIDDQKWTTVNTSANGGGPMYHEAIYVTHGSGYIKLCLLQTRDGEVPFISLIETVPLWDNLYPEMETNATFHLVTRTNLGGAEIRFVGTFLDEMYNRIWTKGTTPSNCADVETLPDPDSKAENNPPFGVLFDSIRPNSSEPIILTVDLPQPTPQPAYVVLYLTKLLPQNLNDTWTADIKINDQDERRVEAPDTGKCNVVTMYPVTVSGPTINITLTPTSGSTLPPSIAAIEVFTRTSIYAHDHSAGTREHLSVACMLVYVICLVVLLVV